VYLTLAVENDEKCYSVGVDSVDGGEGETEE
jgi:hypothetical protein